MLLIRSKQAIEYSTAIEQMQNYVAQRKTVLWLLEHTPVITGNTTQCLTSNINNTAHQQNNNKNNNSNQIPIIHTNRGGGFIYHGPGQRIIYLIAHLDQLNNSIEQLITNLEQVLLNVCLHFHLPCCAKVNGSGVWLIQNNMHLKVGFIGLRMNKDKWISHGIAVNLFTDLSMFDHVNVCNKHFTVGNMHISYDDFDNMFIHFFQEIFMLHLIEQTENNFD